MFKAVELPASVSDLHSSLTDVNGNHLTLQNSRISSGSAHSGGTAIGQRFDLERGEHNSRGPRRPDPLLPNTCQANLRRQKAATFAVRRTNFEGEQ